jgi:hypothetical protein
MPRLVGTDDSNMQQGQIGGSGFSFSGTRIDKLTATSYTLVTIVIDGSGSVHPFRDKLLEMLKASVAACKKSPRSDNILVRVLVFSTTFYGTNGIDEIHGFKPLADINPDDYPEIHPGGGTPLFDSTFSAIGATVAYGKQLTDLDYTVNAINFIITDGADTGGVATPAMIKAEVEKVVVDEALESMINVLVGINIAQAKSYLDRFMADAALTSFIDAGDATPAKLAKLGEFISQSISSQSQHLGTGGPSQQIAATI